MSQQVVRDHEEHRKEIVMCAYAPRDFTKSVEKWAERVTGIDCTSTKRETNEEYDLEIIWDDDGFRKTSSKIISSHIERGNLADEVKKEIKQCDHLNLIHNKETYHEKVNNLSFIKYELMRNLFDELPDRISGGYITFSERPKLGVYEIENDDEEEEPTAGDKVINVNIDGLEKRRILKKEAEREPGTMYESFGEVPSYQFTLTLEAPSEELMDKWTDEVIVNLHKLLNKKNGVRAVRYTSCEVTTTKEGECFV